MLTASFTAYYHTAFLIDIKLPLNHNRTKSSLRGMYHAKGGSAVIAAAAKEMGMKLSISTEK